jgi:hypothetical protein
MAFSVTNDFTAGTDAIASEVNQNFTDIEAELNAFPTDGTLKDGAVSTTAKLANGIITTAKFAATAFYDTDAMTENSATACASQQSIKAYVDNNVPTTFFTYSNTQAFSDTCTTANTYEDLDLSSIVGSNNALVFLKVKLSVAYARAAFRTNGDTEGVVYSALGVLSLPAGASCGGVYTANYVFHALVATDSSGVIEWTCGDTTTTVTITVVGYIV